MSIDASSPPANTSVVYADGDYAGLFRRLIVVVVDMLVLVAVLFMVLIVAALFEDGGEDAVALLMWLWVAFVYLYLAVLKPSRVRTAGYWLTGVRIVTHKGERPSVLRMTFRLLLWGFGPVNPLVDFFWLGGDHHRQTMRDKFAGTYVIKRHAAPVGRGKRVTAYYNFLGMSLVFYEVRPVE